MASRIAKRLMGEAEDSASPSAAEEWFNALQADARDFVASVDTTDVDNIEVSAMALRLGGGRFAQTATWEEAQDPNTQGDWDQVNDASRQVTCYSVYAHQRGKGAAHFRDFKTYGEAMAAANGIAALTGLHVSDFTPGGEEAFHVQGE